MDWAAKMFGLHNVFWNSNEVGGGVIQVGSCFLSYMFTILIPLSSSAHRQTTASDSALAAIVAARTRYFREHPGTTLESLIIYMTSQTHSFGRKAAKILGLRIRALNVDVAVATHNTGLTGHGFRTALEEDRARGLHPFIFSKCFSLYVYFVDACQAITQSLLLERPQAAPLIR
jgi:aromatic-L-amino-acid decarboxylase